jgi:hypothetical protein
MHFLNGSDMELVDSLFYAPSISAAALVIVDSAKFSAELSGSKAKVIRIKYSQIKGP